MFVRDPDDTVTDPHAPGRRSPAYTQTMTEILRLKRGGEKVYHVETGHGLRSPGVFAAAWDAHEQGLVSLWQRRMPGVGLEYVAVRK